MMKKYKYLLVLVCFILLLSFVLGVTGVISFSSGNGVKKPDRLIGVLVTRDLLQPDADGSGSVILKPEDALQGADGWRFLYPVLTDEDGLSYGSAVSDRSFSDVRVFLDNSETEESVRIESTVHMVPRSEDELFWFNSVYQSEDGRVYAVPGNCLSFSNDGAGSVSSTTKSEFSWTENGKTRFGRTEVTVHIQREEEPLRVLILQYGASNELLKSDAYAPDRVPEQVVPLGETEFLIVTTETKAADGSAGSVRIVADHSQDGSFTTLCTRKDGVCESQYHTILWPGTPET